MKKYVLLISFVAFCFKVTATDLTVIVKTLDSKQGQVLVGLYNDKNKDLFAVMGKEYRGKKVDPIINTTATVKFDNIPSGEYAVAAIQDKERTGYLKKSIFGYPLELYGFSNYDKSGKASFDEAKFEVGKENLTIYVNLK